MQGIASDSILAPAKRLISFINASPSPFHVAEESCKLLRAAGFVELDEKIKWNITKGKKYFLTRNKSSVIAFSVGEKYEAGNGFSIIGAHTDSPCLKLKPISKREKTGYLSVGVECYGGGIWNTWFDRDLTVAGRVIVKGTGGRLEHRLVHINRPILRVPHLCIHLQRGMNDSFGANKETEIVPFLATKVQDELCKPVTREAEDPEAQDTKVTQAADKHHMLLVELICEEAKCKPSDLVDMELVLADTQPAAIGGALNEFVYAPRLDNLFNTFCALEALIASEKLGDEKNVRMISLFDNEEVGSASAQGASSKLSELVMQRITKDIGEGNFEQAIANSYLLSADQAHAVHPNYSDKHEDQHRPKLHGGPVVKINSNQKYATTSITASFLRVLAERCGVPLQDFVVRNDSPCGSTIGPILSQKLGIRTLDIGGPMLAMHSIREMCGTTSVSQSLLLFKTFFEGFSALDESSKIEGN